MELSKLLKNIEYTSNNLNNIEISGIEHDSRKIKQGCIYVCLKGLNVDGHNFALAACDAGAVCIIVEDYIDEADDVIQIKVSDSRRTYSRLAANWYDNAHEKLKIIAVTGTNGKTTTTHIIKEILENAGYKIAVLGTIGAYIAGEKFAQKLTTPDPMDFHCLLKTILEKKCEYVIMELSAHALYLKKTEPVKFSIGIFTNLSQDHLDDFETMDNYMKAKKMLFQNDKCRIAVINNDDEASNYMIKDFNGQIIKYGTKEDADLYAENIKCNLQDVSFTTNINDSKYDIKLNIPGRFNVYNTLAAISVCQHIGLDTNEILKGIKNLKNIDGRMESVDCGQDFIVIVDYAHSSDSLKNVLRAASRFTKNRVISVFGCGGDRDKKKRPIMGAISNAIADYTVITSDNPRTENPDSIIDMIEKGMIDNQYLRITNRADAIRYSLKTAEKGDVVLIAGKGHETYQDVMGKKYHFDDREIIREYFKEK